MKMVTASDMQKLVKAVELWCGRGLFSWPKRDPQRVVEYFGEHDAEILITEINRLRKIFYATEANIRGIDMRDMVDIAVRDFKKACPDIPQEITGILAWCYSYDYK